jgi:phosphohistidine phosphatase
MPSTLLLIRHGIAEDPQPGQRDADRALTPEGWVKTRAAMRGLVARGFTPTLGVTSPYRRAGETMACLQEAAGHAFPVTVWEGLVPHGDPGAVDLWLRGLLAEAGKDEVLALTSHQPFLGDLVFHLVSRSLEIKKASCTVVRWTSGLWSFERHLAPSDLRGRA